MFRLPTPFMKPCANTGCRMLKPAAVPTYIAMASRPVFALDARHGRADAGQRLLPGRLAQLPVLAHERMAQAVLGVVELVLFEPLHAREAAGGDVRGVGADLSDPAVLDLHLEPTQGLADATEGGVRLDRHGVRRVRL